MTGDSLGVTAVICTRNRATTLSEHLATVLTAAGNSELCAEVLVIDNGSTDGTSKMLEREFPTVRVVREDRPGLAIARNTAVRSARGTVVLFTDDDVDVPSDWIDRMASQLRNGEADVVVGGIRVDDSLRLPWMSTWLLQNFADYPVPEAHDPEIVGANFGGLKSAFERVPFDENLGVPPYQRAEDAFFGVQAREFGLRTVGVSGEPVVHHFDADRLQRAALNSLARTSGRCSAYVWHHWAHGNAPLLTPKAVVLHLHRWTSLPWLRRHPSDVDLKLLARIAFVGELRRLTNVPAKYPAPQVRRERSVDAAS